MAAGSLLLLMDDIASALDDVALMTKVAASKTAAVVGDDLALNAQQLTGVSADRELRVVWAVAKGSLRNKVVLVPTAILLSAFAPKLVTPMFVVGGCYLCYEGAEKLAHRWLHRASAQHGEPGPSSEPAELRESDRIRGAVRTDFILSAEIIVIALGSVGTAPLLTRVGVLISVGLLMTVGVYGLVAGIVKIDDCGLYLSRVRGKSPLPRAIRAGGRVLIGTAPWLMRLLAVAGTLAMFVVGGGILIHAISRLHATAERIDVLALAVGMPPSIAKPLASLMTEALTGLVTGCIVLCLASLVRFLMRRR